MTIDSCESAMRYERVSCLFSGGGDDDEQMHNLLMNCSKVNTGSDSQCLHVEHDVQLIFYIHIHTYIILYV